MSDCPEPIFDQDPQPGSKPRKLYVPLYNTLDIFCNFVVCAKCECRKTCDMHRFPPHKVAKGCEYTAEHAVSQKVKP